MCACARPDGGSDIRSVYGRPDDGRPDAIFCANDGINDTKRASMKCVPQGSFAALSQSREAGRGFEAIASTDAGSYRPTDWPRSKSIDERGRLFSAAADWTFAGWRMHHGDTARTNLSFDLALHGCGCLSAGILRSIGRGSRETGKHRPLGRHRVTRRHSPRLSRSSAGCSLVGTRRSG